MFPQSLSLFIPYCKAIILLNIRWSYQRTTKGITAVAEDDDSPATEARGFALWPLTRAIFYSACTTAIAFGSLCFSHHPGTSSMGKLMALSLLTTLSAAVIFQPALLATQQALRH